MAAWGRVPEAPGDKAGRARPCSRRRCEPTGDQPQRGTCVLRLGSFRVPLLCLGCRCWREGILLRGCLDLQLCGHVGEGGRGVPQGPAQRDAELAGPAWSSAASGLPHREPRVTSAPVPCPQAREQHRLSLPLVVQRNLPCDFLPDSQTPATSPGSPRGVGVSGTASRGAEGRGEAARWPRGSRNSCGLTHKVT